jgi:dihydrofolate reductase
MILSHVVAVSENNAIGVKNDLPWSIPEDLKFFKEKTLNSVIIMGRKTYESIGRPLPKRTTIVISKTSKVSDYPAGVLVAPSIPAAIELAQPLALKNNQEEVFIVGGGEIYRQSLDLVDKVYLTRVHLSVEADAYYPEISNINFKINSEKPSKDDKYAYTFYEYERKA